MFLQVFPQQPGSVEAPAALQTGVGFLPRVKPHVISDGRARGEDLLADRAGIQLALLVALLVVGKAVFRGKAFGAELAGVGLLTGVRPFVLHQVPLLNKASAARRAAVRHLGGMPEPMPPQAAQLGVADPTVGTGIWLLAGVDPLVHHHVHLLGEALPANSAAVRFLPRVRVHVVRQPRRSGELPAALGAAVGAFRPLAARQHMWF